MLGLPTDYWGKFKTSAQADQPLPESLLLVDHSVDVAACMEILLESGYSKSLATTLGLECLDKGIIHKLCFLALLHDLGKANVDFQCQIFEKERLQRRHKGHTEVSCYFLIPDNNTSETAAFEAFLPLGFCDWFEFAYDDDGGDTFCRMLLASWGHHGSPIPQSFDTILVNRQLTTVRWGGWRYTNFSRLLKEFRDLADTHWPCYKMPSLPMNASARFMEEFNGLLQLADWIASDSNVFIFDTPEEFASRYDFARQRAKDFVDKSCRLAVARDSRFSDTFGFEPNAMQAAFLDVSEGICQ